MLRSARLSKACLACSTPLDGALAVPARLMGIGRSIENPNLCSRCGHHLAMGEIHPVCLLQFELGSNLRFGSVGLEHLSARELPALREQLRSRLEHHGALVLPVSDDRPLLLSAYFNAPVRQTKPESTTYQALMACLEWLNTEISSLGIDCDWSAALTSGYAELVACEGPLQCVPVGQVSFQALQLIEQAQAGQILTDHHFLDNLVAQDLDHVPPDVLAQLSNLDAGDPKPLILLDTHGRSSLSPAYKRWANPGMAPEAGRWAQLSALLLAAIAAPCAAMVVLAPGAAYLGLGAVLAALMPMWKAVGMSFWPRILLTLAAVLIAVINLIRVELLQQRFRALQRQVGSQLQLPRLQRRRMRLIRWTSIGVLVLVALEGILRVAVMKMPLL